MMLTNIDSKRENENVPQPWKTISLIICQKPLAYYLLLYKMCSSRRVCSKKK